MRTVYLCRHAKSSWADPGQDDFDRPLNERGLRDAPAMARHFKARNEPVDLIISSPAKRALTTARAFGTELGMTGDAFREDPSLYHASTSTIHRVLGALPDAIEHVVLFGHNPGFSEAVETLSSEPIGNMPTCGMVRIDFPVDSWSLVARDMGTLIWFDYPKRHPGEK